MTEEASGILAILLAKAILCKDALGLQKLINDLADLPKVQGIVWKKVEPLLSQDEIDWFKNRLESHLAEVN